MTQVKGTFEVRSSPLDADEVTRELGAMRMKFEKQFDGPLTATSLVSMIGVMDRATGSGAYVAIEKVVGQLEGRSGSFLFQHSSAMDRGKPRQSILVVPDSGTADLTGLRGEMIVDITDGQHFYTFDYELSLR
ncbi:MAG TPA: DUF3224 domain-containing protein [Polyangia bacterium]|nr:DUF3224 domain-containing protein [Polyangia bacterium]